MGSRPLRIILKPYSLKGTIDHSAEGQAYWRATTDFPASKNGKPIFGKGLDRMSALAECLRFLPRKFREGMPQLTEENMFIMPDQLNFTWWQVNLNGTKPTKDQWLYERQYWNTFGHLPYYD